ncbi:MAG: hypothetical protein KGO92_08830, partial [Bacteroidota bacterium]|nr:hypothetical protein [Bacteroidota bacterium]
MSAQAQVSFFYNETPFVFNQQEAKIFIDSSVNRTIDRYRQIQEKMAPMAGQSVNLNYKDQMLWILLPVSGFGHPDELRDIMVRNPHINFLEAWLFQKDSLLTSFGMTGDHQPFSSRATDYPDYIFPLPAGHKEAIYILLLIDKRNEQLNIPIHGMSEKGISDYNRKKNLLAGLITGLSLFLFLFSLFLYYNMREKLYIFYGLYIVAAFTYIFSDYGYLFMYFFPDHPGIADFTRPIAISLATPLYMLFAMKLLNVRESLPKQYAWCNRYLTGYLCLFVFSMFFLPEAGIIRILLVLLMQVVQNLTALFILYVAIMGWRKKVPYAPYIIGSSSVLLVSFSFFMLFVSGLIPDTFFTRNLMNLGFSTELS